MGSVPDVRTKILDALKYGNRTFIMNNGQVVLELNQEEKAHMSVNDLVEKFLSVASASDEMLLRK